MLTLTLVFVVVALLCFGAAAFSVAAGKINLIGAGLFFVTLVTLLTLLPK